MISRSHLLGCRNCLPFLSTCVRAFALVLPLCACVPSPSPSLLSATFPPPLNRFPSLASMHGSQNLHTITRVVEMVVPVTRLHWKQIARDCTSRRHAADSWGTSLAGSPLYSRERGKEAQRRRRRVIAGDTGREKEQVSRFCHSLSPFR